MTDIDKFIEKHDDGALINLSVKPACNTIIFPSGFNNWRKRFEMQVKSPAIDNRANKDVIKTLADFFETPLNNIFVISGSKKKNKTVLIKGVTTKYVSERLRECIDGF